ncbi:protein translocase subunit SecD [Adlercreutzia sp. ZJ154]|uniref:protein translocase subunit SecD n=1 Tax=Adlercreutzia sp. ZJ154 TaxID=2709790 RepID=UPI0013ED6137|nr:protein translocase subunit SecD [Adlercreutzia sp. ZJ154]
MALQRNVKKNTHNKNRRNVWLMVLTILLVVVSVVLFMPPSEKINQGLDIRGGLSVVLTAKTDDGSAITTEDMETSRAIIENRVNALGASEATVQVQGTDQILVQIPGLEDTQTALSTIGRTGQLVFSRLDSFTDAEVKQKIENGDFGQYATIEDDYGNSFRTEEEVPLEVPEGTYTPLITGDQITNVTVDRASETSAYYAVNLTLNAEGKQAFAEATSELASSKGKIVIILDNQVESAPAVQSEIPDGNVSITGNYTLEEAKALQTVLESGSLPVSFEYSQSQVVGPTLGQDALYAGLIVVLIGLALVMLYLLVFYKGLGLITAGAMLVFACLYLGILAGLSAFGLFSLSLAGLAGIVLTIGMAADSSILTLERFREEIRMGRSVRAASITGVRHAILTSIDADLVSMVSALSLFFLASASVKGFGLTLALGIVCDIVMMLVFKAPLIRLLAPKAIAHHPGFWGIKDSQDAAKSYEAIAQAEGVSVSDAETAMQMNADESDEMARARGGEQAESVVVNTARKVRGRFIKHDINFLGYRKIFLTVAAVAMVACFAIMGIRGFNFGIEFVGGSSITYTNTGDLQTEELRSAFTEAGEPDAVIQTTTANGVDGFLVRIATTDAEAAAATGHTVAESLGIPASEISVDTIGPDWGASVIQSSLIAFVVSMLLIIVYIAIRFEYKMGVIAVVALLHDLILVLGIYALVGREVNPNTIAALLTILGYSLYDTVVVFHRVNDNMKGEAIRCTFMTMANHSINQVFVRTINTTLTSFVPVFAMLLFGGETLKDFAFAMSIGLLAGSYSSFAVAMPLYSMWKSREPKFQKLQKKYGNQIGLFQFDSANSPEIEQVPVARLEAEKKAKKKMDKIATDAGAGVAQAGGVGSGAVSQAVNNAAQEHKAESKPATNDAKNTASQKRGKRPDKPKGQKNHQQKSAPQKDAEMQSDTGIEGIRFVKDDSESADE